MRSEGGGLQQWAFVIVKTGNKVETGNKNLKQRQSPYPSSLVCLDHVPPSTYGQFCEGFGDCEGAWGRRGVLEDGS